MQESSQQQVETYASGEDWVQGITVEDRVFRDYESAASYALERLPRPKQPKREPDIALLIERFGDDYRSDREYSDEEIAEMQRDPDTIFPAHGTFNDPVPRKKEVVHWRSPVRHRTNIGKQWQCRRYRTVRPQAIKAMPVTEPEVPELSLDDLECLDPEQREWLLAHAFTT
jgi:hypothetical protein